MTATTEVVISEKSKLEFLMSDLSGTASSRMSTICIWALFLAIPVTVRPASSKVLFRSILRLHRSQGALGLLILQQVARLDRIAIHADPQEEMTMAATDRFDVPPEIRAVAKNTVGHARPPLDASLAPPPPPITPYDRHATT